MYYGNTVIFLACISYVMGAYDYFAYLNYSPSSACANSADVGDYEDNGSIFGESNVCFAFD